MIKSSRTCALRVGGGCSGRCWSAVVTGLVATTAVCDAITCGKVSLRQISVDVTRWRVASHKPQPASRPYLVAAELLLHLLQCQLPLLLLPLLRLLRRRRLRLLPESRVARTTRIDTCLVHRRPAYRWRQRQIPTGTSRSMSSCLWVVHRCSSQIHQL